MSISITGGTSKHETALGVAPDREQLLDDQRANPQPHGPTPAAAGWPASVPRTTPPPSPPAPGRWAPARWPRPRPGRAFACWKRSSAAAGQHASRRIGAGMLSISKMKPDSSKAGRKPAITAAWLAANWFFATVEISKPRPASPPGTRTDMAVSAGTEPRNGTRKANTVNGHRQGHRYHAQDKIGHDFAQRAARRA